MDKILFINACVRKNSRTFELANHVLSQLQGDMQEVRLYEKQLLPLSLEEMQLRDEAAKNKDFSNEIFHLANQFACSNVIVIAAPYWDLAFPAVLKNYLEKITVNGLTFAYGANGIPYGLCQAKKLIYVTTSGGPIIYNFGYDYVSALSKSFYGITNLELVKAEGLDIYGADVAKILEESKRSFKL